MRKLFADFSKDKGIERFRKYTFKGEVLAEMFTKISRYLEKMPLSKKENASWVGENDGKSKE